jgi:hypothetical protein
MQTARPFDQRSDRALRTTRSRRARSGVAMVEAVILVPVLGMLLIGTLFVRERYLTRQRALVAARRCAWEYALSGCDDHALPASCSDAPRTDQSSQGSDASQAVIDQARLGADGSNFDVFDEVPILGTAMRALFGTTTSASVRREVRVPWSATGTVSEGGEIVVACNQQVRDALEAAKVTLRKQLPALQRSGAR